MLLPPCRLSSVQVQCFFRSSPSLVCDNKTPASMFDSILDGVQEQITAFQAQITAIEIDDSSFPYLQAVVAFIAVEYVWETYLDIRQRHCVATKEPPLEHYSAEHLEKTRAYSLDKKNFALIHGVYDTCETLLLLLCGGLPLMWAASEGIAGRIKPGWEQNEYAVSIVFALVTSVIKTAEGIPWGLYSTFVIEERHGFNKQTLSLFFTDMVKSTGIAFLLMPPVLGGIIFILRMASPFIAIYLWGFMLGVQLIMMTLYPAYIAPLFNKYSPLEEGELKTGIEGLAERLSFPLKKLYVVDGSKRSGHSNAYMYGFGKSKRIVLYDTLLTQCNSEQVVAVLAHELGHWKLGHTICLMVAGQAVALCEFSMFALFRGSSHLLEEFGFVDVQPVIMSLSLFMMVVGPIDSFIGWLFKLLSRRYEFQADRFAVSMKHAPQLTEALKILDKENKSDFVVDGLYSQYHYSHPPLSERLKAIHAAAKKLL